MFKKNPICCLKKNRKLFSSERNKFLPHAFCRVNSQRQNACSKKNFVQKKKIYDFFEKQDFGFFRKKYRKKPPNLVFQKNRKLFFSERNFFLLHAFFR